MPSASAALVSSHSRRVSSLMKRSSNSLRSWCRRVSARHSRLVATRTAPPHLIGAAGRAVKATILHDEVQHVWPDLRRHAQPNDVVRRDAAAPHACFGSSSGASCVQPAPSSCTRSRMKGDSSATWGASRSAQGTPPSAARPRSWPRSTHAPRAARTSRSTSLMSPSANCTHTAGVPAPPSPASSSYSCSAPSSGRGSSCSSMLATAAVTAQKCAPRRARSGRAPPRHTALAVATNRQQHSRCKQHAATARRREGDEEGGEGGAADKNGRAGRIRACIHDTVCHRHGCAT